MNHHRARPASSDLRSRTQPARRTVLSAALAGALALPRKAQAALTRAKITRVRFYENPGTGPISNQSTNIVTIETDAGLVGVGEGGTRDSVMRLGSFLIGQDPSRIQHLWQLMYRGDFYPPGREKIHALGALDMALWDIHGKALGVPVHALLGGLTRDTVECYATRFPKGEVKLTEPARNRARACIQAGFRAFRTRVAGPPASEGIFDARRAVDETVEHCRDVRVGVGAKGDWCIDYHTRLDFADAVRLSNLLEPLNPLFCEDLVRSENPGVYRELRAHVNVPIAVGEQFGDRWEINELIEGRLIDHSRVTMPNVGGITEMIKLATLAETHYVGLIPHFTGPVSTAALVHVIGAFSGFGMMELYGDGSLDAPHLRQAYDLKKGRLYPNQRPGLGVELDTAPLKLAGEVDKHTPVYGILRRPDGSLTNW